LADLTRAICPSSAAANSGGLTGLVSSGISLHEGGRSSPLPNPVSSTKGTPRA
jgi:hypothetical protein